MAELISLQFIGKYTPDCPTLTLRFLTLFLGHSICTQHDGKLDVDMSVSPPLDYAIPEAGILSLHRHMLIPGAGQGWPFSWMDGKDLKEPLIFYCPPVR